MGKTTIGSFIAVLRKSNGMTQQELADRLNVSNKTISKWECNDGYPELTLIPVLAEIFNVSSDEILQGCRINKEDHIEKSALKTDKQVKRLINNTTNKFKIISLISSAISIFGFVLLFVIAYGAYRPYIGLGVLVLLIVTSFVLETINLFSTKVAINGSELLEKNDAMIVECNSLLNKCFFYLIMLNIFFLSIGLPIGLMGDAYSVVTIEYFGSNVLPSLIFYMIPVFLVSYVIFQVKEQGRMKEKIENNIKVKSQLKKLNIIFWIITCPLLLVLFIFAVTDIEGGPALYFTPLLFIILCFGYLSLRKVALKKV